MDNGRLVSFALVAPALLTVGGLFVYPLGYSMVSAFATDSGQWTLANFEKAYEFYSRDIWFTALIKTRC